MNQVELARRHAFAEAAWGDREPPPRGWSSGPWSLELRGDELADIRFDDTLVLRMVRAVARDRDWATVPASVTSVAESARGLEVGLRLTGLGADIVARLRVDADGDALVVSFIAESLTDFDRNRLGLVALHPPTVAGEALTVVSPAGARVDAAFPKHIAPHQPALDIARLEWRAGGLAASLRFAGEVFEMEDQRNWTDASFKSYSTPLALPFPVRIAAGSVIEQSLVLRCEPAADLPVASRSRPVGSAPIEFVAAGRQVPSITVGASTAPGDPPAGLRIPADALLVELEMRTPNWLAALERAARVGLPLDVRIVADSPAQIAAALDALVLHRPADREPAGRESAPPAPARGEIVRLAVFSARSQVSEPGLWEALVAGASARGIRAQLLGGARSHFTELNRSHERLPPELPALAFSLTPQMHATERSQLIESLAMQRLVAEDAVRIAGHRAVHIGPVTLRPRYNAVATSELPRASRPELSEGYGAEFVAGATDIRQQSRALCAWTVASAAALAVPGIASISYFEAWGPRGIVDGAGNPFPVDTAVTWLHEIAGEPMLVPAAELPDDVWAIGATTAAGAVALLANLTAETKRLTVVGVEVEVELEPFAAVRCTLPTTGTAFEVDGGLSHVRTRR